LEVKSDKWSIAIYIINLVEIKPYLVTDY
jgi:hypothetical protein